MPQDPMSPSESSRSAPLELRDLYEQGSQSCRQYSQLTMTLRTLAQQVTLGSSVGLAVFFANAKPEHLAVGLTSAGVLLLLVAAALDRLNLHYSRAFVEIRDRCLVPLENSVLPVSNDARGRGGAPGDPAPIGPWSAHRIARGLNPWLQRLGWHGPYIVLALVGIGCICLGLLWHPSP